MTLRHSSHVTLFFPMFCLLRTDAIMRARIIEAEEGQESLPNYGFHGHAVVNFEAAAHWSRLAFEVPLARLLETCRSEGLWPRSKFPLCSSCSHTHMCVYSCRDVETGRRGGVSGYPVVSPGSEPLRRSYAVLFSLLTHTPTLLMHTPTASPPVGRREREEREREREEEREGTPSRRVGPPIFWQEAPVPERHKTVSDRLVRPT